MIESVTRVVSRASNLGQSHGYRTKTPKTRFTVNEKPISSPRLKSFPAEKVKKFEEPPQNSSETIRQVNSGQGDVLPNHQQSQSQNVTTSDQLIPRNVQPASGNLANLSEPAISSRKENIPGEQPHRPFVPVPQSIHYHANPQSQPKQSYSLNIPGQTYQQEQRQLSSQFSQPVVQNVSNLQSIKSQAINSPGPNAQQFYQYEPQRQISQFQSQPRPENSQAIEAKKKTLKFTPAMIKDQELLVMTMKQQGIREDLMRRQFDALLAEQRKQLLYLEQLKNPQSDEPQKLQKVNRKVSKIEEDGKPEWMLHITPPRIPYSVIEQMKDERQFEPQVSPKVPNENMPNQSYCQRENCDRHLYNLPWQMNSANVWQQQPQYFQTSNNIPTGIQSTHANVSNANHPQHFHAPNNMQSVNQAQHCHAQNNMQGVNQPQHCHVQNNMQGVNQPQHCHAQNNMQSLNQAQHCYTQNNMQSGNQEVHHGYPSCYQQQATRNEVQMSPEMNQAGAESQRNDRVLAPSSLLKLRLYKEVIKKQKQNNGLQDPETIKEAMEALKNPANRKGLEYLDNLNKKREKVVALNGVQDPQDVALLNHEIYASPQPRPKVVSANGLENTRNPNNPLPPRPSALRQKKMEDSPVCEYPKQRTTPRNYYTVMAERENGTVASNNQSPNVYGIPAHQQAYYSHPQMKPDRPNYSYPGHSSGMINDSNPANNYQNLTPRNDHFHPGHPANSHERQPGFNPGEMTSNNQRQGFFDPHRNNLYEPVIIGGVQYLARKPEYSQTPFSSQHYPQNHGNGFNPAIVCQ